MTGGKTKEEDFPFHGKKSRYSRYLGNKKEKISNVPCGKKGGDGGETSRNRNRYDLLLLPWGGKTH